MKILRPLFLTLTLFFLAGLAAPAHCLWSNFGADAGHTGFVSAAPPAPYTTLWKFFYQDEYNMAPPAVANGRVYWVAKDWLFCLNQDTGERIWEYNAQVPIRSSPLVVEDKIILADTAGIVHAFKADTGAPVWAKQFSGAALATPLYYQGKLFIGLASYEVRSLSPATGDTLWTFKTEGPINLPLAGGQNCIIALESSGAIYALDSTRGVLLWRAKSYRPFSVAPVVSEDLCFLVSGNLLYAMTLRGGVLWKVQTEVPFRTAPAVTKDTVYVTGGKGLLYALAARSGGLRWTYTPTDISLTTSPVIAGDTIFVGGSNGAVIALQKDKGELLWQCQTRSLNTPDDQPGAQSAIAQPVVADGSLLVLYNDGNLTCFSPQAIDLSGPTISDIAPAGRQVVSGKLPLALQVRIFDEGSGLDKTSLEISLDGEAGSLKQDPVTGLYYYFVFGKAGAALVDGPHTVRLVAKDYRGNVSNIVWRFATDENLPEQARLITDEMLKRTTSVGKAGGQQATPKTTGPPAPGPGAGPPGRRPGMDTKTRSPKPPK